MVGRGGCGILATLLVLCGCSRSGLEAGAPPSSDTTSTAVSSSSSSMCMPDGGACSASAPCCDSECVDGICGAPRCQPGDEPVLLADELVWPMGLVVDRNYVYFVSYDEAGAVYRAHKDGGPKELLSEEVWPHDIAFDEEHLYVSIESNIIKMRKDGSDRSVLASTFGGAGIGLLGSDVVWAEYFGMNIKSVSQSGGSVSTLAPLPSSPFRLLVHQDEVYFTGVGFTLHRLTGDGGYDTLSEFSVRNLTADDTALYLSITHPSDQARRQPLDGGDAQAIFVTDTFLEGIGVDNAHVFVSTANAVFRANKSGPPDLGLVYAEPMAPGALGVDASCVYVVVRQPGPEQSDGKVVRISKSIL